MRSPVMLAPNPNRSMKVDRVVVVGRNEDGSILRVLSIDGLQNSEWAKQQFGRYFLSSAYWNLAALGVLAVGIAASFLWHWWVFIPALLLAGWCGFRGKVSGGVAGLRIIAAHPSAVEHFAQAGLVWEMPADKVVPA